MVRANYILIYLLTLNLLILCSSFIKSANSGSNNLRDLVIVSGSLSEDLLLYFDKDSTMIYYKENIINNILNNKTKEVVFLVPQSLIKDMSKITESLKNLNGGYDIKLELCDKPINGIKIILNYNPDELILEYGHLKDSSVIFLKLYKKDILSLINDKTNTFRWYC